MIVRLLGPTAPVWKYAMVWLLCADRRMILASIALHPILGRFVGAKRTWSVRCTRGNAQLAPAGTQNLLVNGAR